MLKTLAAHELDLTGAGLLFLFTNVSGIFYGSLPAPSSSLVVNDVLIFMKSRTVIPIILCSDRFGPRRGCDGADAAWRFGAAVPGGAAAVHNRVAGVERAAAQLVVTQVVPDVLDGVEFRAAGAAG